MWFLRQSTAGQEIPLGPFLDSTDANTAETALTIANTDIKLHKTGATAEANKNSGGATHIASGRYYAVLDATDTDTIGPMRVSVHVAGALAVWLDCCVLDEAVYDVWFGTTAPATAANVAAVETDTQDIQSRLPAALVGGRMDSNAQATAASLTFNLTGNITGNLSGSVGSVTGAVGSVTGNVGGNVAGSVGSVTGNVGGNVVGSVASVNGTTFESIHLDHLIASADPGGVVANSSFLAKLVSKSATPAFADFDNTTDSLQALRDNHPANFSTLSINASGHVSRVVLCDTVTTLTGHTPQTGDAFARLGAPAGASHAADVAAVKSDTAAILLDTGTDGVVVAAASKSGYTLAAAGLDAVVIESGITAGAGLTNDTGTQLTTINARQMLSLTLSALGGVLAGAATTNVTTKPGGKPAGNTRIDATVDANGNRSALNLKVPD